MNLKNKSVLIVSGAHFEDIDYRGFEALKREGVRFCHLGDGFSKPRPGVFDQNVLMDLADCEEVYQRVAALGIKFDAVAMKNYEAATTLVAGLAQRFGVRGNSPSTAFNCRSKFHMRQIMAKAGLPSVAHRRARNLAELLEAIEQLGTPCVAKPIAGNSSLGAFLVSEFDREFIANTYNTTREYIERWSLPDGDLLPISEDYQREIGVHDAIDSIYDYVVEEYIQGQSVSIDSLVQDGRATVTCIAEQTRMQPPFFLQVAEHIPYRQGKVSQDELEKLNQQVIDAFDIKDSATHLELKLTENGPKLIEIAARMGGDNIQDSVFQTTGLLLMEEVVRIALGQPRKLDTTARCHTATHYFFPYMDGILERVALDPEIQARSHVTELYVYSDPGERVAAPPVRFDYLGYLTARGETRAEAEANARAALAQIKVEIRAKQDGEERQATATAGHALLHDQVLVQA